MKVINLGANNSIINQFVAELRDVNVQKDRMRFRNNVRRIGNLMAYEISKTLKYKETEVVTPLATANMMLPVDNIVIGTVFRAGLPFHEGFLDIFDKAGNAFLSAYRYYTDRECNNIDVVQARGLYWYARRYMTGDTYEKIGKTPTDGKTFTKVGVATSVNKIAHLIESQPIWKKRWSIIKRIVKTKQQDSGVDTTIVIQVPKSLKDNVNIVVKDK